MSEDFDENWLRNTCQLFCSVSFLCIPANTLKPYTGHITCKRHPFDFFGKSHQESQVNHESCCGAWPEQKHSTSCFFLDLGIKGSNVGIVLPTFWFYLAPGYFHWWLKSIEYRYPALSSCLVLKYTYFAIFTLFLNFSTDAITSSLPRFTCLQFVYYCDIMSQ